MWGGVKDHTHTHTHSYTHTHTHTHTHTLISVTLHADMRTPTLTAGLGGPDISCLRIMGIMPDRWSLSHRAEITTTLTYTHIHTHTHLHTHTR